MVFLPDSVCAFVLFAAALLSWRMTRDLPAGARVNARFAAALMATLAGARLVPGSDFANDAALVAPSLAAAALALALCFPRRTSVGFATTILVLALAAGLAAILMSVPALAIAFLTGAALAIFASACSRISENPRQSFFTSAGAVSLFLGASSVMHGSLGAAMLFFAASLLAIIRALEMPIAEARRQGLLVIGGERA